MFKWVHKKKTEDTNVYIEKFNKRMQERQEQWNREHGVKKETFNLSRYIGKEYLTPIYHYVIANKPATITLASTVEELKDSVNECFVGIKYSLKVCNTDTHEEIIEIPISEGGDGCFVSMIASWKRKNRLLSGTLLGQYLKAILEYEFHCEQVKCQIDVVEDIHISRALLFENEKDSHTFTIQKTLD